LSTVPEPALSAVSGTHPSVANALSNLCSKPGSTQHSFGQEAWKNEANKKVRVMIKDLPPASNNFFGNVDKVRLAKLIRYAFLVDITGSTCEILQAANKNAKRSGHIDVSRKAAETIAAKLATGGKLELKPAKKTLKVRLAQICQLLASVRSLVYIRPPSHAHTHTHHIHTHTRARALTHPPLPHTHTHTHTHTPQTRRVFRLSGK